MAMNVEELTLTEFAWYPPSYPILNAEWREVVHYTVPPRKLAKVYVQFLSPQIATQWVDENGDPVGSENPEENAPLILGNVRFKYSENVRGGVLVGAPMPQILLTPGQKIKSRTYRYINILDDGTVHTHNLLAAVSTHLIIMEEDI